MPALAECRVEGTDRRSLNPQLYVMPWRMLAVLLGHLHRLRIAAVRGVVAARMTQIDAPDERDVSLRFTGMPDHHQLLVMRPADADSLIEQHLPACAFDGLAEVPVLLLAVGELVQMGPPHQTLDDDAAFGGAAEQFTDGRAVVAHLLVGVAPPVREEQMVARCQRFHFRDETHRSTSSRGSAAPPGFLRTRRAARSPDCHVLLR